LQQQISKFAISTPDKIAITGDQQHFSYQQLLTEIKNVIPLLEFGNTEKIEQQKTVVMIMDNHPAWAFIDLALLFAEHCAIPLPKFFSIEQLMHALLDSNADIILLDNPSLNDKTSISDQLIQRLNDQIQYQKIITIAHQKLILIHLKKRTTLATQPLLISKISYTSGTTAQPKGVLLSANAIESKVISLAQASEANVNDCSISILHIHTEILDLFRNATCYTDIKYGIKIYA
jgi:long-subunit acyl-CoA synthetase (AMP-forming)